MNELLKILFFRLNNSYFNVIEGDFNFPHSSIVTHNQGRNYRASQVCSLQVCDYNYVLHIKTFVLEKNFMRSTICNVLINISSVGEFERRWVLKIKIFVQESTFPKEKIK